jgi:hypothetical protein
MFLVVLSIFSFVMLRWLSLAFQKAYFVQYSSIWAQWIFYLVEACANIGILRQAISTVTVGRQYQLPS